MRANPRAIKLWPVTTGEDWQWLHALARRDHAEAARTPGPSVPAEVMPQASATAPRLSMSIMNRRSTVAQITLTREEAATLRGVLNSYLSDLRMEIADTDSMQFREDLKREEETLKKLLQQLDAELSAPGASP